jgi:hypothetical protein
MSKSPDRLVARLREVHEAAEGKRPSEVRRALDEALREGIAGVPETEARAMIVDARAELAGRRPSVGADAGSAREIMALRAEVADLRADRARLAAENRALQTEKHELVTHPEPRASGDVMERLQSGLLRVVRGERLTPETVGIPREFERLFKLMVDLIRFVIDVDTTRVHWIRDIDIGPQGGGMNTQIFQDMQSIVRKRFEAVLDNKDGSLKALSESLKDNHRFLFAIITAFNDALSAGSQAVLQELDPPPILEAHRGRVMGYDYEKAWKEITRRHGDLRDLSQAEFYLRYFKEPFVEGFWKVQKGQG